MYVFMSDRFIPFLSLSVSCARSCSPRRLFKLPSVRQVIQDVMQCVAVNVALCSAVFCSVLQFDAMCCSVLH